VRARFSYRAPRVRRSLVLVPLAGTLLLASSTAAALQPGLGERSLPLVRAAKVLVPAQQASGRTTVIVTLGLPPLAAARAERSVFAVGGPRKLNLANASSRTYLARVDAAQRLAIAELRRAIPEAEVARRYRIILDGFSVSLPTRELPELMRMGFVERVYPSLRYMLSMNRGPSVIGAPAFQAATGAGGDGVKVAVVDDGVDQRHTFLDPAGMAYPPGYPKGDTGFTTPKVIAARAFAAPSTPSEARRPLDEGTSFHGTFVAGVIAGRAGTTAPRSAPAPTCRLDAGGCHPEVTGLSGVAPNAWIGNYRVFSLPAPLGGCCAANTPEIVAAFEAAVADGMDVINFSGGGPESDPRTDALIEAVANVSRAGVVPVISAGNDRDLFGLGTVGSPSTAPDSISVAATANAHMFTNTLSLVTPSLGGVAFVPFPGSPTRSWVSTPQPIVDVGSITGTDGRPVPRQLCSNTLPSGALARVVALATRGGCGYETKAARAAAAGANGLVLVEDRGGDPGFIPIFVGLPGGVVSDLDGARIRGALGGSGGRGTFRVSAEALEVPTSWGGVPTSFSSAGPTAFDHDLKPDLAAPGAEIISSTLFEFAGDPYAVLDGTSFSAPHVSGAAALLLQRHPSWSPRQLKSALMTTAGPAWRDTARTTESPVYLQGAGLAQVGAADTPLVFTDPQSLSFRDLNVAAGSASVPLLVVVTDAGGGSGTWQVGVRPQTATAGVSVEVPGALTLAPGGQTTLQVVARASAGATPGDQYGFVVLTRAGVVRRIPYGFSVTRPRLTGVQVTPLVKIARGDTRAGENRVARYRWPTEPFGILGYFGLEETAVEDGAEKVYSIDVPRGTVNFGVVVIDPALKVGAPIRDLLSANAPIHPWLLGALDENSVQGYSGMPINGNAYMDDYIFNVGAAGIAMPVPGRYYVAVDSGRDPFTGRSLAGRYTLRSWINDVKPPRVTLLTRRVGTGRPTFAARVTDAQAGIDPLSLLLEYKDGLIRALTFDPTTGIAVFAVPKESPKLEAGPEFMKVIASDFQETKNVNTSPENLMPNTAFAGIRIEALEKPAVTWLIPTKGACVPQRARLQIVASSPAPISSVGFFDGTRQIARVKRNVAGVYQATWRAGSARRGTHTLTAVASSTDGREGRSFRTVRVCRG
jgi:subtilisin family serine protease